MLDDLDRRILRFLQSDPTAPLSELAERCRSQPATVARRLDRLKADGVLRGLHAVIDWAVLGYGVEVSLAFYFGQNKFKGF
jgi:Lrp/AsnC family transcriptional regulator